MLLNESIAKHPVMTPKRVSSSTDQVLANMLASSPLWWTQISPRRSHRYSFDTIFQLSSPVKHSPKRERRKTNEPILVSFRIGGTDDNWKKGSPSPDTHTSISYRIDNPYSRFETVLTPLPLIPSRRSNDRRASLTPRKRSLGGVSEVSIPGYLTSRSVSTDAYLAQIASPTNTVHNSAIIAKIASTVPPTSKVRRRLKGTRKNSEPNVAKRKGTARKLFQETV